jgi:hypothetical protein
LGQCHEWAREVLLYPKLWCDWLALGAGALLLASASEAELPVVLLKSETTITEVVQESAQAVGADCTEAAGTIMADERIDPQPWSVEELEATGVPLPVTYGAGRMTLTKTCRVVLAIDMRQRLTAGLAIASN